MKTKGLNYIIPKTLEQWLWHLTGLYNWAIRKIELDAKDRVYHSEFEMKAMVNGHSKRLGIPSHILRGTIETAHGAWQRCFKKLAGRPRFKGQRNKLNSIPFGEIPKRTKALGVLKHHKQKLPVGVIKSGRIIKRASGWYLALFIDAEPNSIPATGYAQIGIDPGFKSLLTLSNGEVIGHPRELEAGEKRLGQAQRGKNLKLAARLQERIANRRKDRNHKISRQLIAENSLIAFSKDNSKGIARKFGKSVSSSSHCQLRQMLAYKCRAGGRRYIEVNSKFSTKRCSNCGSLSGPSGLRDLAIRDWVCKDCGVPHERDVNAARNTLKTALGISVERVA